MRLIITMTVVLLACGSVIAAGMSSPDVPDGDLEPAAGRFLVAQRSLYGPWFSRTVIYLIRHDTEGTVGVIVNRPLHKQLHELVPDLQSGGIGRLPLYAGGPVSPHTMVLLMRGNDHARLAWHVKDDVYASSNTQLFAWLSHTRRPPGDLRMFVGQAGWGPGQLEQELDAAQWYVTDGDPEALFDSNTDGLWSRLINRLDPLGILVYNGAS